MHLQWETWKCRDDMNIKWYIELKKGPDMSDEDIMTNLATVRENLASNQQNLQDCLDFNELTQNEDQSLTNQEENWNNADDHDNNSNISVGDEFFVPG